MKTWLIEPRDPLIARDGRPFGLIPGARATSLQFPYPSTTTGTVRTRAGSNAAGVFEADPKEIIKLAVSGPVLVELDTLTGQIADRLLPAPADALLLEDETSNDARRHRLVPLHLPDDVETDLDARFHIVGMVAPAPAKPYRKTSRYWRWKEFEQWLIKPPDEDDVAGQVVSVADFGHSGPPSETRTHVKIDPHSQTAEESLLFQTRGLEFTKLGTGLRLSDESKRLALALATTAELTEGIGTLGGERRLAAWRESEKPWLPDSPENLAEQIAKDNACRLVLLTPAIFKHGWRPDEDNKDWLQAEQYKIKPTLAAALLPRYQVISGWDYEKGGPKPTRRMVPAGAVYFVRLKGERADIEKWAAATWRSCVSDALQDQLDGFGLAALGVWSGQPQPMRGTQ